MSATNLLRKELGSKFTRAPKTIKYISVNVIKEIKDLYNETGQMLTEDIENSIRS